MQGTGWDFGILKRWERLFVCLFLKGSVSEAVGTLRRWHLWPEIMNYSNAIDEAKSYVDKPGSQVVLSAFWQMILSLAFHEPK